MYSEDKLVERVIRTIPSVRGPTNARLALQTGIALGVGQDAAVLRCPPSYEIVLTCDAFLEGRHFLRRLHPPESVGYKALVRAVSDVAAMGAQPTSFFLTLALPTTLTGKWLDGVLKGMARAARKVGVVLAGGDTSELPIVIMSLTVLGKRRSGRTICRSGASPGDLLYVSGSLGRAQLGLKMLRKLAHTDQAARLRKGDLAGLLRPHLFPRIPLALGSWLNEHSVASSLMDISDGLSTDLPRLCAASGVGARLWADRIPGVSVSPKAEALLKSLHVGYDPLRMALDGGDDYELLFTVPRDKVRKLARAPGFSDLRAIGEIVRNPKELLLIGSSGRERPLESRGWDPFRRK